MTTMTTNHNGDDFPSSSSSSSSSSPSPFVKLDEHDIFRTLKVVDHHQKSNHQTQQRWKEETPSTSSSSTTLVDIRQCHCYQLERWDCGVACLIMVHRWLDLSLKLDSSSRRTEQQQQQQQQEEDDQKNSNHRTADGNYCDGKNLVEEKKEKGSFGATTRPLSRSELWMRTKLLNDDDHMLAEARESIWTPDLVWQLHQWRKRTMMSEFEKAQENEEEGGDDDDDSSRHSHVQNSTVTERFRNLYKTATKVHQRWLEELLKIVDNRNRNTNTTRPSSATFEFLLCSNNLDSADETYENYEYYEHNFASDSHRVRAIFQLLKEQQDDDVNMILTTNSPPPSEQ